jgi:hypothetical protein
MRGVDHVSGYAGLFRGGIDTLEVTAGAFHYHTFYAELQKPSHPVAQIALKAAERTVVLGDRAIVHFDQHSKDIQHPVDVHSSDTSIKGFHDNSPGITLNDEGDYAQAGPRGLAPKARSSLYRASSGVRKGRTGSG